MMRELEGSLAKTQHWVEEIGALMRWDDPHRAYQVLRATLHAVRDRLDVDHAAALGAQLPLVIRGLYYEGWHPSGKPYKVRDRGEFLGLVACEFDAGRDDLERAVRAVLRVLSQHVSTGEIDRVRHVLPRTIGELWPVHAHLDTPGTY